MYTYDANPFEGQATTYASLRVATDVSGTMRNIAVKPDQLRVGLGKRSWDQLETFFTDRGVKATLRGPYFLRYDAGVNRDYQWDRIEYRVVATAVALYEYAEPEDEVRWDRTLIGQFGRAEPYAMSVTVSDRHEIGYCKRDMIRFVRESFGALPGEHRVVQTPVCVLP